MPNARPDPFGLRNDLKWLKNSEKNSMGQDLNIIYHYDFRGSKFILIIHVLFICYAYTLSDLTI